MPIRTPSMTRSVYDHGASGDLSTDDTDAVQEFFDYCANNPFVKGVIAGSFNISRTIRIRGQGAIALPRTNELVAQTAVYECDARFLAVPGPDGSPAPKVVLEFENMSYSIFYGRIMVDGYLERRKRAYLDIPRFPSDFIRSDAQIKDLKTDVGIRFRSCERSKFEFLWVTNVRLFGIEVLGDSDSEHANRNNLLDLGTVRVGGCGPANAVSTVSHRARWSNPNNHTGRAGTLAQECLLDVTSSPPAEARRREGHFGALALIQDQIIGERFYVINEVEAKTIQVSPWVSTYGLDPLEKRTVEYFYGAGVRISGSDANLVNIDSLDASRCSIALHDQSAYGPLVKRLVADNCGIAYVNGHRADSRQQGQRGTINGLYLEGNSRFTMVDIQGGASPTVISAYGAVGFSRLKTLARPLTDPHTKSGLSGKQNRSFRHTNWIDDGRVMQQVGGPGSSFKQDQSARALRARWMDKNLLGQRKLTYTLDSWEIWLPPPENEADEQEFIEEHRNWGKDTAEMMFIGTQINHSPLGPFKFGANNRSWKLNGLLLDGSLFEYWREGNSSDTGGTDKLSTDGYLYDFTGPVTFAIHYDFRNRNIVVVPVTGADQVI